MPASNAVRKIEDLGQYAYDPSVPRVANPIWNPWCNDRNLQKLYYDRCIQNEVEMTCAEQAIEILTPLISPGERVMDAGSGPGYYYWSFKNRGIDVEYHGIDNTPEMVEMAHEVMCPASGLPKDRIRLMSIEDLDEMYDTVMCINVLPNEPHYARPLERLMHCTRKNLLIRASFGDEFVMDYRQDTYLDEGKKHIRVYHNTYPMEEVKQFIRDHGFDVQQITDKRTNDGMEVVCDVEHHWRILLATRKD